MATYKDETMLILEDNKDFFRTQTRLALRKLERRLLNDGLYQVEREFQDGLANGEIREHGISLEAAQKLIAEVATKLILEPGK